jgi:hypothetical protein
MVIAPVAVLACVFVMEIFCPVLNFTAEDNALDVVVTAVETKASAADCIDVDSPS